MSSKIEEILEFNRKVLADTGVIDADGEGFMSYLDETGKLSPVTIDKKRLCLTTPKLIQDNDWTNRIPFSPLSEQINQGPSPVLNALKNYIWASCTAALKVLATELLDLASDTKRQKALPEKASIYLASMIGVDEKTKKALKAMFERLGDAPEKRLITMFLKNGGKNGALRSCEVSFPFLDDANSDDPSKFFGVDMPRKTKDKAWLVALFDYILGDKDVRETYSQSSSDGEAPYFHSLLLSFHKLASRMQRLIDVHSEACPGLADVGFKLDWTETLEKFSDFAHSNSVAIPPLPGNRGQEKDARESKTSVFNTRGEDVGHVDDPDLPWNGPRVERSDRNDRGDRNDRSDRDRDRDRGRGRDRDDRDDRRDDRQEEGVRKISASDLLSRRSSGRDDRDRGRDRDRDDRSRDRGRNGGRDRGRY